MHKQLDALKNEIAGLQVENKIEEAHAKLEEVKNLKKSIAIQEELEEEELQNMGGFTPMAKQSEVTEIVAFNKALLGKPMTEVENALVEGTDADGGYLVPLEQKTQIDELKRALVPLKAHCQVIPVGTMAGSMAIEVEATDELIAFEENTEINQSSIKFGQVKWALADYGDIIPVSNTLLQDEKANLVSYIGKRFAKKAVRTENTKIITELKKATVKTGTDYTAINTVLNKELDPAISAMSIIITNQDGFDYLDGLVDGNGRPLLTTDLTDATQKLYKGRKIVVLPNNHLASTGSKLTFFIGSLTEFLAFFDRQAYAMAKSQEAGFTKNVTLFRCIERFDVKTIDTSAMVQLEITPVAVASVKSK